MKNLYRTYTAINYLAKEKCVCIRVNAPNHYSFISSSCMTVLSIHYKLWQYKNFKYTAIYWKF